MRNRYICLITLGVLYFAGLGASAFASCSSPANAIEAENCLSGSPQSQWDVTGAGDPTIQGFATDISFNRGSTANFKINTPASAYTITIYRMGYYSGMGARQVATVTPSAHLPQSQPACITDNTTKLYDCGNWGVSASWTIPSTSTSGIYFAKLVRTDTGGSSHIFFIVRNDSSHSDLLFQTSDLSWQAYNDYGLGSLYGTNTTNFDLPNRAFKVSYNRPFHTRSMESGVTWVFNAEYPMVRFLEANGFDVSYLAGMDTDRSGSLLLQHKVFLSVGHDEYWSGSQRANLEAARAGGVHLAFFSGNEVFWKTRWENSIDGSNTAYRTLVCYKETLANQVIDPKDPPTWTGTWRDPRFSPPADGGRPENGLTGTIFMVNGPENPPLSIQIPSADGNMRFWRNTSVANQPPGQTVTLPAGSLGYEWDIDADNGSRPAGLFHVSTATYNITGDYLLDYGGVYGNGTATHNMTMYRAASGALIFGAGTVQWSWGLDSNHDAPFYPGFAADVRIQQATVNLFADMGVQPATLQGGLITAIQSIDTIPPSSTILSPISGSTVQAGSQITITGSAADTGGGVVGGVEVSVDSGTTWHPATGRENWSYNWTPLVTGPATIRSRAVDDSGNIENPSAGVTLTVAPHQCPCTIWSSSATPGAVDGGDPTAGEYGVRFRSDVNGSITGIRFYKAAANTGSHIANLWSNSGTLLATATFTGESSAGWQQVNFSAPVAVTAGTSYVASYYAPSGHYSFNASFFTVGVDNVPLHALADGVDGANGVYAYSPASTFPTSTYNSSNYWVDVVLSTSGGGDGAPTVASYSPLSGSSNVSVTSAVTVSFSEAMDPSTINSNTIQLLGPSNTAIPASVSYNTSTLTATLQPVSALTFSTIYTALVHGGTADPRVKDLSGNALAANFSWSFSTATAPPPPGCPCTIWPATANPGTIDGSDPTPGEYGVKFQSDLNGSILGIRFYESAANSGSHIVNLWTTSGTLLASATASGEGGGTGWQQINFNTPVAITANTVYVASYFAPNGHYAFDAAYFNTGVDNPPLHALGNGVSANGVYSYSATSLFPTSTFNASNYWVDVALATTNNNVPPAVSSTSPANAASGVSLGAAVIATFSEPMNPSTINSSTVLLVDSLGNAVAGTVTYASATSTVTFQPTYGLLPLTTYTASIKGTVQDMFGNAMGADFNWSFSSGAAPANSGPGGPILVISNAVNPFSRYYGEILSAEGLNEYTVQDITTVSASTLAPYDVAILGDFPLTAAQVSMITTWVNNGGRLVAMHPDHQLATLLGLTASTGTMANEYLLVNTSSGPGVGIVGQSIQYHSTADLYSLNGATSLATLYSNASTPTTSPAATLINAGAGQAAAFTYDLARSIVYTRQGNPAWSGEKRDGQIMPVRSDDLFYGNASFDPEPDWIDLSKVAIPQADEQQRLLVNLILQMDASHKPLPRFWYFPSGFKAVVVMTGDDHGSTTSGGGATAARFNQFLADSPAGCNVANWQCVRSTSYVFPPVVAGNPLTDAQVAGFVAQGFEVGVHVDTVPDCALWTPATLPGFYSSDLASFASAWPSAPKPKTHRTHCISWSDYDTQPQVELSNGIRLDTNYYYWPATWINNQPGMFTGSGMPMRFTDRNGNLIDVYQATTQMTDESGQTYPFNIQTLLQNALGTAGYYGAFVANMHNDTASEPGADSIVATAQPLGVPIVSALQMLTWMDGRNSSSFGSMTWANNTLSFTVVVGAGALNLQAMLPASAGAGALNTLTANGSPVSFTVQTIKGMQYAVFNAAAGAYQALYGNPQPGASLSPTSLAFGNQQMGTTSSAQTLTLSNTGSASLTLTSITITGTNSGDFAQSNTCGATLNASASCSISVTFKPTTTGARSATVSVNDNAAGSPQTAALSGTGTAPAANLSPSLLSFGNQQVGTTSTAQTLTLSNPGTATLSITSITLTGSNAGDFSQTNTCGSSVNAGASCSISVTFKPTVTGSRSASLSVNDNATGSPQTASLSGTGTAPVASLSPTSLAFGNQLVNTSSAPKTLTLSNTGTATLSITGITLTGSNAGDFSQTNTCGSSVNAGANCTISVTFKPTATGSRSASLSVNDNATGSPQTASLSGTGTAPVASLSPTSLAFGNQLVNTSSAPKTLTLSNTGTATLSITGITLTGSNAGDFSQTNTCGSSVNAGANCTISVTFKPTATGSRSASLSINDNATGSPQTASLTGTGTNTAPGVSFSPASLAFGTQKVGTTSATKNVTLTNTGNATLTITSITITGTNPGDFSQVNNCGSSVSAGKTCIITATFKPKAVGARAANIAVNDNANGSPQTVPLTGTGTGASASPTSLNFGNQSISKSSAPLPVTLSNAGTTSMAITSITITGSNPGDYSQTNNCGSSLAAGGSCTINVTFKPQFLFTRTANLQINDADPTSPQIVTLTGAGTFLAARKEISKA